METTALREPSRPVILPPAEVVTKPTTPEQIHDKTAERIAAYLRTLGHQTTKENVEVSPVFPITPELISVGAEAAEKGGFSAGDVHRLITDELEGGPHKGVVLTKGPVATTIAAGRRFKKSLGERLFKKAT